MGKGKFINKHEAATLQMVYRPSDHIGTNQQNQNQPIFQAIPKNLRGTKAQQEKSINLADLIEKKLNEGDYTGDYKKKPIKTKKLATTAIPDEIMKKLNNRDDLWINQLNKKKLEESDEDDWEDDDEEDEDDQDEVVDEFDYRRIKLHPDVRMKRFDDHGLPLDDGYDYSQHIQAPNERKDGDLVIEYFSNVADMPHITVDMDLKPEEMNQEQKEIFEALEYEGHDKIYEELEDDFVRLVTGGEACILPQTKSDQTKQQQQPKKEHNHDDYQGLDEEDENEDDEDYDDEGEEEEEQNHKRKDNKKNKRDEKEEYSDMESCDINSEDEKEFEREMEQFDQNDSSKVRPTDNKRFNNILDDHILAMKKAPKTQELPSRDQELDDKRQKELMDIKKKDYLAYLKEKFPLTDPSEFVLPKDVVPLTFEQDIALQNYYEKLRRGDVSSEMSDGIEEERDDETIVTRALEQSQMSKISPDQLNIIKWIAKGKKATAKPKVLMKEIKQQYKEEQDKKHVEEVEKRVQLVRPRNETKEEKKSRKDLTKEIKTEKKNLKRNFKETFKDLNKKHTKQLDTNRENTNTYGISVVKVQ